VSLRPFLELKKQVTNFHEIWHERYAIGGRSNTVHFNLLAFSNSNMADAWICEVEATLSVEF